MAASRVKKILASLLSKSGCFSLRARVMLKDRAVIFMYHRVLPRELVQGTDVSVQPGMYVTPESLREHLSYLKMHFFLIPFAELIRRLQDGEDISRCAVLTFDDGWLDNYTYAFPILQELKVPATIFLTSGFIGTSRWFWPEEIGWTVLSVCRGDIDISLLPDELSQIMKKDLCKESKPEESIERIVAEMKLWDEIRRSSVAKSCAQIREKVAGEPNRLLMNWGEVREMVQSGLVNFGSHTVSHALLDQLPMKNVQQELYVSAAQIHEETGLPVEFFAYPNGNYTQQVLAMLSESDITAAVTIKRGVVHGESPLLELPRIAVHEDISNTQALFQWRIFIR